MGEILTDAAAQIEGVAAVSRHRGRLAVVAEVAMDACAKIAGNRANRVLSQAAARIGGNIGIDGDIVAGSEEMVRRLRRKRQHAG